MKRIISIVPAVMMVFMLGTVVFAATEEDIVESNHQPDKKAEPIDGTDYTEIEQDKSTVKEGFSGAREATEKDIAESNLQPDKKAVPIDGTDYTEIEQDKSTVKAGFGGAREATEKDIAESKYQASHKDKISAEKEESSIRASWYQLDNMSSFYYYPQAKNYSCGAACVRTALRYLTGMNYSEAAIRAGCNTTTGGTFLVDMKSYINSMQSANTYVIKRSASKTTMKIDLYSGIVTWDAPPIMRLEEKTSGGWPFNLNTQFVTIHSVKSDKSEVAIAAPWAGYVSSTSSYKWYDMSTDDVYTAYNAVDCGYMY